ncbi:transcription activator effector-binding protein [Actinomadura sp. NBRC 104412]|uniref:GyrI-like domain-containing protein n=1 Tax=Actinomadura sp. NBRC 104412 TaxID=3032203 RepID=UPI0024A12A33|nr:GyrI-like domain-containing protein [Actinomadura sp. NBRC 104412]GLZ06238.1 transcription activator effector-binding protein [Actinomadura sp. NBRC 104412]
MMTDVQVEERRPQRVISVRKTIPIADLTKEQGDSLHRLWRLLRDRGVTPAGPPFVRYHTFGDTHTDVETGVPVDAEITGEGPVTAGELPGGRAVVTEHLGGHDRLGEAYQRIEEWLAANGEAGGPAWEVYHWIDLTREPDIPSWPAPDDWRTDIVQPIK